MKNCIFALLFIPIALHAQLERKFSVDTDNVAQLVTSFKKAARGPYKDIRWFCNDGTINSPKEPCDDGGVQHARYKQSVIDLAQNSHIYLGQILASSNPKAFWDASNFNAKMKQYQLEQYLKRVDNGWIHRKSQFYRGAIQAEDETAWGKTFFTNLLSSDTILEQQFYTVREALKDVPHSDDTNVAQLMRGQSKAIADAFPKFMNLRIKIHGHPEFDDIAKVKTFKASKNKELSVSLNKQLEDLIGTMESYFAPVDMATLEALVADLENSTLKDDIALKLSKLNTLDGAILLGELSDLMMLIRLQINEEPSGIGRLGLLDLSIQLERMLVAQQSNYKTEDLDAIVEAVCFLAQAASACGYSETWEYDTLQGDLNINSGQTATLGELNAMFIAARKQIEWGVGKNKSVYKDVVDYFANFEPLALGFIDDRIRGSVALYLGQYVGKLGDFITKEAALENKVLKISNQSKIHGLNPGFAMGKLIVVEENEGAVEVNSNHIYVFERPPSDLNPVAGLLNISEGNLVSHLQLLARNLGIPNTAISKDNFNELKAFEGQTVFYAVSNNGTVIIKMESDMTNQERNLFKKKTVKSKDRIEVPVDRIKLSQTRILNLEAVNAQSSGILCGPKAANLGELKQNFPDHVVDGFVIPFGVFKKHLDQHIAPGEQTYWEYLKAIYAKARAMRAAEESSEAIERYQLDALKVFSEMVIAMPLLDDFTADLERSFTTILKKPIGQQPVFLRSDTNMEDLPSFTGAGINLTLFNIKAKQEIIDGIKKVWASPYYERSFKWRQKYLNNPENVFPSIVVIPGVDNDMSGVMITKGVASGHTDEITVAMSRGVGGAVDGQLAETWTIKNSGETQLIAPAREVFYNGLSNTGGTVSHQTTLDQPILDAAKLEALNAFHYTLIEQMKQKGISGPFDVELGFKDQKIWLFQVRPFVENKKALNSEYLQSITPKIDYNRTILLNTTL